jgi:hypothetical protein
VTSERLLELKARAQRSDHIRAPQVLELVAEVERLQASNAGLREALLEQAKDAAHRAVTLTFDNQARAVSKGSAPYSEAFLMAALDMNIGAELDAALAKEGST